jgi:hypothetical protein
MTLILTWLRTYYDRLIACAALLLLLGALLHLAVRARELGESEAEYRRKVQKLVPDHPVMQPLTTEPFDAIMRRLEAPFQAGGWSNAFLNPELRVRCVDCRKPIPFAIEQCPFCKARNPAGPVVAVIADGDRDGMNDEWERQNGLNPNDPADAGQDRDGDGFTNLEEFLAGTDPRDAESHPPFETKIVVDSVVRVDFRLRFKSYMKEAGGSLVFQLNTKDYSRTYFARMGEKVGEKGEEFILTNFVQKIQPNVNVGGVRRDVDASELTLIRDGRPITLVLNLDAIWDEYRARLVFAVDRSAYAVKKGDTIEVRKIRLTVKDIDIKASTVVLTRESDGRNFVVGKGGAADAREPPPEATKEPQRDREPAKE